MKFSQSKMLYEISIYFGSGFAYRGRMDFC